MGFLNHQQFLEVSVDGSLQKEMLFARESYWMDSGDCIPNDTENESDIPLCPLVCIQGLIFIESDSQIGQKRREKGS